MYFSSSGQVTTLDAVIMAAICSPVITAVLVAIPLMIFFRKRPVFSRRQERAVLRVVSCFSLGGMCVGCTLC